MRPIVSARPGNVNLFLYGKRWFFFRIKTKTFSKPTKKPCILPVQPNKGVLAFLLHDLLLVCKEGCLDCFFENLQQVVEGEEIINVKN